MVVWSPVLLPEIELVPVTASVGVDVPDTTTEFTEVGVMAPNVKEIAGTVELFATVPLTPLPVLVTDTLVTLPTPTACHDVVVPLVCKTFPMFPLWLGKISLRSVATQVASARKNFLAAAEPAVGGGTKPFEPPVPLSATISGSMAVT